MSDEHPHFLAGLLRIWLAFSVTSFVAAVCHIGFDYDNPLRSDDPYLAGALAGGFGAFFTLCSVLAAARDKPVRQRQVAYLVPVGSCVSLLLLWDWTIAGLEGHGIATMIAILVGGAGILAYLLLKIELARRAIVWASVPGILWAAGYSCAATWMVMR